MIRRARSTSDSVLFLVVADIRFGEEITTRLVICFICTIVLFDHTCCNFITTGTRPQTSSGIICSGSYKD
jgi:hypothetical protein